MDYRKQLMTTTIKTPFVYYTSAPDISADSAEFLKQADEALKKNQLAQTTELYRRALEKSPRSSHLLSNLGTILATQEQLNEGIQYLRKALELNSSCIAAYYNLGSLLLSLNAPDAALIQLKRGHELEPRNKALLNNLGLAYLQLKQLDRAKECFEKALQDTPEGFDVAFHNIGCIAYEKNDLASAQEVFEELLKRDSSSFVTRNNLACVLFLQGEAARAVKELYQCIQDNPEFRMPVYNIGMMVYLKKLV